MVKKKGPEYRYLAKREVLDKQQELRGMDRQIELPFPTMDIKSQSYKVFGMVTNMDWEGEKLIQRQTPLKAGMILVKMLHGGGS
jgi:hypothetical protein